MVIVSRGIDGIRWFFRWWLGELAGLLPETVRRFFRAKPDTVIVDISAPEVLVARCREHTCREVARFPAPAGAEDEGRARAALKAAGVGRQRTALRLSGSQALRKTVDLPLAAEGDLRSILSHQIERHTPFKAEDARFGYRILGRDRRAGQMTVELTVVPQKYVDAALDTARHWGLEPDLVDVSTGARLTPPEIDLISDDGGGKSDPWPRVNAVLALAVIGLGLAAVIVPLENARDRADRLLSRVTELRRASQQVLELRRERDELVARIRFIAERKLATPSAVKVFDELTRILPKDTWLYEIRITRPEIRISGYSPSASSLVGKINDSPLFSNPRFRSPVTRPSNIDKERFNLSFELVPQPSAGGK